MEKFSYITLLELDQTQLKLGLSCLEVNISVFKTNVKAFEICFGKVTEENAE